MEKDLQADQLIEHIYIHVPFCQKKCDYCSFYSLSHNADLHQKFYKALHTEIEQNSFPTKPKTIYFGGGTPSLLTTTEIKELIELFPQANLQEITLEVNPGTIDTEYIEALQNSRVNRLSLGVQSFLDEELKSLGRIHDAACNLRTFKQLREAGFPNISCDLIYGLPKQSVGDLQFSIDKFLELEPEHISTYCLSLEKDVRLYSQAKYLPEDEELETFYHLIRTQLVDAGYNHYELSNFARTGYISQHNLAYWQDKTYLGFGPGASGYYRQNDQFYRYQNRPDLQEYLAENFSREIEKIEPATREREFIFLNLRKMDGLSYKEYSEKFGCNFLEKYAEIIEKLKDFLVLEGDHIRLSNKAYFISDEIFAEFM